MKVVYAPMHLRHRPRIAVDHGKPTPHPEQPERVEAILRAIMKTRWASQVVMPREYSLSIAQHVHTSTYLMQFQEYCDMAAEAGPGEEWFPYVWPADAAMDTGTPVQAETLEVAWASASVALTGADFLLEGEQTVYALCRPPGHHASSSMMGGRCYLNNAALAADRLLNALAAGGRVAILDLDIHHGNGTQEIFYANDQVFFASIHHEPKGGYPPHTGFATEEGTGAGRGFNYNQPLPRGTGWDTYSEALEHTLERISVFGPAYLIVSQGFDTYEGDPWGGFLLRSEHYGMYGGRIRQLSVPVLVVLEGGYEPTNLAAASSLLLEGLTGEQAN